MLVRTFDDRHKTNGSYTVADAGNGYIVIGRTEMDEEMNLIVKSDARIRKESLGKLIQHLQELNVATWQV